MEIILGLVDCKPEETGYDSSRLDALHRHLEKIIKQRVISGATYCISHKGKIIANASIGSRSRIGSVSGYDARHSFWYCIYYKSLYCSSNHAVSRRWTY